MTVTSLRVRSADGAAADLAVHGGEQRELVYWLPALGVAARHYAEFAAALAARGIGCALHEWRGAGSSDRRAARGSDWGYRDLLEDVRAGLAALRAAHPGARIWIGGHSLGGQLAALALALDPALAGLLLVASGMPYWRCYPWWQRPVLWAMFGWFGLLVRVCGYFPGRRTGFGGNEAATVMRDWIRSGRSGSYRHAALEGDLDAALARVERPLFACQLRDDGYVPPGSLAGLLAKMANARLQRVDLTPSDFAQRRADHFSWLKEVGPVVDRVRAFIAATH
jgi:predicted alpha/beta hydrolase